MSEHKTIDVHDLPDAVVQAIEAIVHAVRENRAAPDEGPAKTPPHRQFPVWPGTVIGDLSREEIYEDVDRC